MRWFEWLRVRCRKILKIVQLRLMLIVLCIMIGKMTSTFALHND